MNLCTIYLLRSPSNKVYIGQTKRDIKKRLWEHQNNKDSVLLYNAIKEYGFDNFQVEILIYCNEIHLNEYEKKFIALYKSIFPNGYNIRSGGAAGSIHCDESRLRMSLSKLGEKNHNFGKVRTEMAKLNISNSKKGEKHHFYGKKLTEEHKLKCAISHRKNPDEKNLPMYLTKVKPRPEKYIYGGYAITNHPKLKNKYFTSKKLSDSENYELALKYLNNDDISRVHRLNDSGSI